MKEMVICLIALVVFGIMGIFSAKYRQLAKDAFHCTFNMIQLKPCDTGFEQRVKTYLTAQLMPVPSVARFFYNNFKAISWVFVAVFFVSIAGLVYGFYNFVIFGNCNGPTSSEFCVFNSSSNVVMQFLFYCNKILNNL